MFLYWSMAMLQLGKYTFVECPPFPHRSAGAPVCRRLSPDVPAQVCGRPLQLEQYAVAACPMFPPRSTAEPNPEQYAAAAYLLFLHWSTSLRSPEM